MYREYTFRLDGTDFPIARFTALHPEARVMIYNVGRDPETQFPIENIYLVRAPKRIHDDIRAYIGKSLEVRKEIETAEPDTMVLYAKFQPPERGRFRGFLAVLLNAVGVIMAFRPIIIEDGNMDVSVLVLPKTDTQVRVRALAAFAREEGIKFRITRDDPVPYLPVRSPRMGHLDLLEAQVIQAIHGAGAYELEGAAVDAVVKRAAADIEDGLGITDLEFTTIRARAEKKILREFAEKLRTNLRLSTPKTAAPDVE